MGEIHLVTPAGLPQDIKDILSYLADLMFAVAYGQGLTPDQEAVVEAAKTGIEDAKEYGEEVE